MTSNSLEYEQLLTSSHTIFQVFNDYMELVTLDVNDWGIFEGKPGINEEQFVTNMKKIGEDEIKKKLAGKRNTPFKDCKVFQSHHARPN